MAMSSQIPLCLPNLVTQPDPAQESANPELTSAQRRSSSSVYEAKWCLSNQVEFRAPPLKAITDFLLHLFQDRKLQSCTIDGYRSAIADKQGNSSINFSKDENLTHLLDSFHRDRPKGRRAFTVGTFPWCCTS